MDSEAIETIKVKKNKKTGKWMQEEEMADDPEGRGEDGKKKKRKKKKNITEPVAEEKKKLLDELRMKLKVKIDAMKIKRKAEDREKRKKMRRESKEDRKSKNKCKPGSKQKGFVKSSQGKAKLIEKEEEKLSKVPNEIFNENGKRVLSKFDFIVPPLKIEDDGSKSKKKFKGTMKNRDQKQWTQKRGSTVPSKQGTKEHTKPRQDKKKHFKKKGKP